MTGRRAEMVAGGEQVGTLPAAGTSAGGLLPVPARPAGPPVIPYEEALRRSAEARGGSGFVQGALAIDWCEPDDSDPLVLDRRTLRRELPPPIPVAARLAPAMIEVMAGVRPAPQLVRWTSPDVYEVIARRAALASRRAARGAAEPRLRVRVRRVRGCEPADGVAEVAVVLQVGPRVRAVALRLVGHHGRWRVESMQLG